MTFTRALPFQSTFPRGERRGPYLIFLSPCRFQSTFPRGERHLCWLVAVKHIHFNPRSLVGNDYIPVGTYTIVEISIHVPSWGTTIFTRRQPPCILFQSTFPRGERRKSEHKEEPEWQFQSTFPRGERQGRPLRIWFQGYFNPRSLVGNDVLKRYSPSKTIISIHVPSWGTTKFSLIRPLEIIISIHVPSWGTTIITIAIHEPNVISIHVPSWGTTPFHVSTTFSATFQSTFPRGERRQIFTNILCFFMQ